MKRIVASVLVALGLLVAVAQPAAAGTRVGAAQLDGTRVGASVDGTRVGAALDGTRVGAALDGTRVG